MPDHQPRIPSEPTVLSKDIRELLGAITNHIAGSEFEDLIQRCIEESWTLDQAKHHVAFQSMLVEWYLDPHGHPNAIRYALTELKQSANEDDYEQLHPSLKINERT